MNLLARVYLLLITLLLVILLTVFLLSPAIVSEWAANISEVSGLLRIVVAVLLDVVLLALAFLQIRPARRPAATGLMMRASGAVTEVSVDSARDRILKAVSDVRDVVSVEARVTPIRGRADVDLDVEVLGEDVRLPDKQRDINRALKQVINKQLGLQMAGSPHVHIRLHGEKPRVVTPVKPTPVVSVLPMVETEKKAPGGGFQPDETTVKPVSPPVPVVETRPEPESKETGGLLGGLFRRDRDEKPEPQPVVPKPVTPKSVQEADDLFSDTPELAALLRSQKPVETELSPIKPVVVPAVEADEEADDDESKTLILDLDKEIAASATEDLVADTEVEVPNPTSATEDEGESKSQPS